MAGTGLSLRQLSPADGEAYAAVLAASPDTGSIGTAVRFEIDPYRALMALHQDTVGVVAGAPDHAGFAGSGLIRFGQCQWEGELRPSALLNTLVVHPDFRRRGVASQLAGWREQYAHQRQGDGVVIWAVIQRNNTGSERTARKWAREFLRDRVAMVPLRMRASPPPSSKHLVIRPPRPDELDGVADQLNQYYREYNLYSPESRASLAAWLEVTTFDTPFRHYRIAADKSGALLAGLGLSENCRLRTTLITHLPAAMKLLNRIFRVVPLDGELREIALSRVWYAPGQERAARALLETVRWEWRDRGTSLMLGGDVRSPIMRLPGLMDRGGKELAGVAVRAPVPCAQDRLFCYG